MVLSAFNPALGLIHLLTSLFRAYEFIVEPFQSRTRAYPSSDDKATLKLPRYWYFQSRTRAYPSSDTTCYGILPYALRSFNPALGLIHLLTLPGNSLICSCHVLSSPHSGLS